MNNFSKVFQQKDLILYPGCGRDIQPLLLPKFRAKPEQKRHFVYCDYDDNVISFYRNLKNMPNESKSLNQWRSLNPQYRSFFDSHGLTSIKKLSFTEDDLNEIPHIKLELELTTEKNTFISKLDFFGTDIQTYLKKYHLLHFEDYSIKCVLYIKQQYRDTPGENHFFSINTFNNLLKEHALLKDADFVVCDTRRILDSENWRLWLNSANSSLPGWGVAGNSLNRSQSALIYERDHESKNNPIRETELEEIDLIVKKLNQLKFNL